MLDRVDGPECPACGCRDSEELAGGVRWGVAQTRRQCRHCGQQFSAAENGRPQPAPDPNEGVVYEPLRCPRCRTARPRVVMTRGKIRHHRCDHCGHGFKSVEAP